MKVIKSMADVRRMFYPKECPTCGHSKERHRSGHCNMPVIVEMGKGVQETTCDCNDKEGKPHGP